jgi:hypothetical protein
MGLFSLFRRKPARPPELLEALIAAANQPDAMALAGLCARHRDEICRLFPTWRTIPDHLRFDPAAQHRYCRGLIAIAAHFESFGDPSLIRLLTGDAKDNPLVQWQQDLTDAQALIDNGRAAEAVVLLRAVLERTRDFAGDGVSMNLPRTLGTLGVAYYRTGDTARAMEFTGQALELCRRLGDEDGIKTYTENIRVIQAANDLRADQRTWS